MLSIAMATYNGERFLREQLDSILAQTVTDFEVIVCDDCSTDCTVAILEEYARLDKRFNIYKNTHNLGFKKNFEQAIGLCKGDYIALCDQDDIWYPDHLELLLKNIGDCVMCCGNSELVNANNQSLGKMLSEHDKFYYMPYPVRRIIFKLFFSGNPMQGASMLVQSEFVRRCLPIPAGVGYHDAWLACCGCMESQGISYFFEPITRYRQHANNVTANANREHPDTLYMQVKKGLGMLFCNSKLETDRWAYIKGLQKLYGNDESLDEIASAMEDLLSRKGKRKLWMIFWHHYEDLITTPRRVLLPKRIVGVMRKYWVYSHWTPINANIYE